MKATIKITLGFIVLAIIAFVFFGSKDSPSETVSVKFGYLPVVHALPLYVAIEKGYFEEEGVTVEVVKFEAPNQIIDALLGGQIDMSMAGATGITAIAESQRPNSLRIFAIQGGDPHHIADGLIVRSDSTINSIENLKGKKVGTLPGIQWRTIARNLFATHNIDINKDLALVELAIPLQAQALASKQVDALLTIEPALTVAKSQNISKYLVQSPNLTYISNPFYAGVGNVSVEYMKKNPETFKKIMKVMDKATKEVKADPDGHRKYLVNYTPLSKELASEVNLPIYKMYGDITHNDMEAVQKFIDIFTKYEVIKNQVNVSALLIK